MEDKKQVETRTSKSLEAYVVALSYEVSQTYPFMDKWEPISVQKLREKSPPIRPQKLNLLWEVKKTREKEKVCQILMIHWKQGRSLGKNL